MSRPTISLPDPRPLVYIRAPYSDENPFERQRNVLRARVLGGRINLTGLAWAIVPHNASEGIAHTLGPLEWYAYCLALMPSAKGVWWSGHRTTGCDLEGIETERLRLPTGTEGIDDLVSFLHSLKRPGDR